MNDNIKRLANNLFVQKEGVDMQNPANIAAIITAACEMASFSSCAGANAVIDTLLDVYEARETDAEKLIGMSPSFVKGNIGYATDFRDFERASAAFQANQDQYEALYSAIRDKIISQDQEIGTR